ncbi:Saccharopine dehydrogenase (NADP(+), L-glutamate-forming) [Handroanthus impetiginosus]|uniref:Saccharopine dehydrogenase (NADP(+), L-glutamate-forming) n=1 Tax=Handroanthus impetiginosus TaxID=429701 RepID=A0A2G9GK14_9LAMI|nr:Saccharopine dehydrogenase (NADP(+), L-glutamate-forming) [Handroanthus impetiginosus]
MARFCLQWNIGSNRNLAMAFAKETGQGRSGTIIERSELPAKVKNSRILILGGTGKVGGSTALALSKFCPDLRIIIGGRNRDKGKAMVNKLGNNAEFFEVDINDSKSLEEALQDVDLVVHTAGPFLQAEKCSVLEAAIQNKTAYLDVCDDTSYAQRAKSYMKRALDANVPAITTGGICPGDILFSFHTLSFLHYFTVMAAELVRAATSESKCEPQRLRFYYYAAGSGGAGPAMLLNSILLLGEEVVAYDKGSLTDHAYFFIHYFLLLKSDRGYPTGEKIELKPYSGMLNIDFGQGIGKKDVFLLNLPEVRSIHKVLGVPTVSARFGTAPFFWNWGMTAMTYLLPPEALRDRRKAHQLVQLLDPLVRAVDGFTGETVSIRVDLDCSDGRTRVGIFSHKKLSESVGISTAAFVLAILEGSTQPGVWFPEEPEGISMEARETLLSRASQGTTNFVMNMAPWMVETIYV